MLTTTTNKTTYAAGEPVTITLTLTNDTKRTQTYEFNSSQRYDIIVRSGGNAVWQWSDGRGFLQVLGSVTLQPGQSVTYTDTWNQQVAAGTYEVVGMITSSNLPVQDPATITIA